ncbi:MAG: class I SAM-dependent methyltransferase [Acidobacteriota bacterium]
MQEVRRCRICGAAFSVPLPAREDLAGWYTESYFQQFYGGDRTAATARCGVLLDRASRLLKIPAPRLLDIGCGVGDLAVAALQRGWQAIGLESAQSAVQKAAARGVPVVHGDAAGVLLAADRDLPLPQELRRPFDLVVLRDTLGHLPGAGQVLAGATRLLRAGGWLVVRVPNRHTRLFRWARLAGLVTDSSGALHLPAQILHLDRAALQRLLGRQGLEHVCVEGESEGVRQNGGRYSRRRWADAVWRMAVARWERMGEPEALVGWGCKP